MSPLFAPARSRSRCRSFFRPAIEALEDRTLFATGLPQATADVNFTIGRMVADPVRDLVYVADQTDARVLAVDTDLGRTVANRALAGEPGAMAVSLDGSELFVAEPGAFQIEVLSLPDLTPVNILPVGFEVDNLVATVNDHLFANTPATLGQSTIDEIDAQTGMVLDALSREYYYPPLLRTNATGTNLYVWETGVSSPDATIDEYDVSGSGSISLTNNFPAPVQNGEDFVVNESANRIYTADGGVSGIGVIDTNTNARTTWSFGLAPYGVGVAAQSSGPIYGAAADNGIFEFEASGNVLAQYPSVGLNYFIVPDSLKITPNGNLLYANYNLSSNGADVYRLAILGTSSLDIDTVPIARFTFSPVSNGEMSFDASTSSAGVPGETLTSYAWEFGDGTTGTGETTTHAYAGTGPFTVRLTVTNATGQSDEFSLQVTQLTSALPQPTATADVNFTIGQMVADPVRDLVYVADQSDDRILAVDTNLGRTVTSGAMASAPGALAVSIYGDRLFVAEPDALQIQVLSLPELNLVKTLHVGTQVGELIAIAGDRLVISDLGTEPWSAIDELDGETGKVLATVSSGTDYESLLRTNAMGTKLYVRETGLQGADSNIDEYDVSGAVPISLTNSYPVPLANSKDFVVNESARRIYTSDGGVDGVGVTDMDTKTKTVVPFAEPDYGVAVAAQSSGPIYGASAFDGIFQFGASGIFQAQYPSVGYGYWVMADSLKITPNGHLLYASTSTGVYGPNTLYRMTILGASSLVVDDIPVARFTFTPETGGLVTFDAKTSEAWKKGETLTSYNWNFGDGTISNGLTITHKFAGPGPYTVQLIITSSSGQTDTFSASVLGGSISGTVYKDVNGNGAQNNGERGLAGWAVYLDVSDSGQLDPSDPTAVTAANGNYVFTGLPEGVTYHVRELVFAGWQATTPTEIDVPVNSGRRVTHQDFGDALLPMISGNVFHDFLGNGTEDIPLKGWVVYLNATRNGKPLPGGRRTTTAADGSYAFTGLEPGVTYQVHVVLPKGWLSTTPARIDVTAAAGVDATGYDFGVALPVSITGNVFDDVNADGRTERGERGLSQWTVFLDANGNGVFDPGEVHVLSDSKGNYKFVGLAPGTYTVRLVIKSGWKSVLPQEDSYTVALTSAEVVGGEDYAVNV